VLIGSRFMIQSGVKLKRILHIWVLTLSVTVPGLAIMFLISGGTLGLSEILICIFPFFGRAYWFVSSYIVLMLLSPFLNILLTHISLKQLLCLTGILCSITILLPCLLSPPFDWSYFNGNDVMLFICLYLISDCFYRLKPRTAVPNYIFILGCVLCISLLVLSVYAIEYVSLYKSVFVGKQEVFYHYSSILVVGLAICYFGWFSNIQIHSKKIIGIITWFTRSSLAVYLLHMHPVVKKHYVAWGIFQHMPTGSGIAYAAAILGTAFGVFMIGSILSRPFLKFADWATGHLMSSVRKTRFFKLCDWIDS